VCVCSEAMKVFEEGCCYCCCVVCMHVGDDNVQNMGTFINALYITSALVEKICVPPQKSEHDQ
jgi:hypothetical protein